MKAEIKFHWLLWSLPSDFFSFSIFSDLVWTWHLENFQLWPDFESRSLDFDMTCWSWSSSDAFDLLFELYQERWDFMRLRHALIRRLWQWRQRHVPQIHQTADHVFLLISPDSGDTFFSICFCGIFIFSFFLHGFDLLRKIWFIYIISDILLLFFDFSPTLF